MLARCVQPLVRSFARHSKLGHVRGLCAVKGTETGKIEVNGVSLHYACGGGGLSSASTDNDTKPRRKSLPVLCLCGALGTAENDFGPQLSDDNGLAAHRSVISFDPRGYGKSQPPTRDFPPGFYARDAEDGAAMMNALGHDRYHVMGWSDGAISAVMLAAQHKEAVSGLVIFGGNAFFTAEDIEAFEKTRDVKNTWSSRMKESLIPVYGEEGLQQLWGEACDGWQHIFKEDGGRVCETQAKEVEAHTLIMHGAKDPICLIEHPYWFEANMTNAASISLKIFEEGKHNFHVRFADEFNREVESFLSSIEKQDP